jgi:Ni,Fe-hydrogenase III small subunit
MFVLLKALQALRTSANLPRGHGGSLAVRHVDAGSCNGCEHELQAATNPYYDLQRFGLTITASPRHADVLLVTGPVTRRMLGPLKTAYAAMPEPKLVAALGDCALGCNVLGDPSEIVGSVEAVLPVTIRIPGCPPGPEAIAEALARAMAELRAGTSTPSGP